MKLKGLNLQLFNDQVPLDMDGLDSLLDGNTVKDTVVDQPVEPNIDANADAGQADASGGDPGLDSSGTDTDDGAAKQKQTGNYNAAMAKMRIENARKDKTLFEMAKALGIEESDPEKLSDQLISMAQEKLAKDSNVPIELYKELSTTREQLSQIQFQQNQQTAREKFSEVQKAFDLDDKALLKFAAELDEAGVNAVDNPSVDLEYEYYKRNREALEQKRIKDAVEEALRKSNTAETHSTTPGKQTGKKDDAQDMKINNVSALNSLLDGKS